MVIRSCIDDVGGGDAYDECLPHAQLGEGGIMCLCGEDNCNVKRMDALLIASRDAKSPQKKQAKADLNPPKTTPRAVATTTDAHTAPGSSDDSLKSADPEKIVLLIGVIITFMLL